MKKNLFLILAIVAIALISACGTPDHYKVRETKVDSLFYFLRFEEKASSFDVYQKMLQDTFEVASFSDLDRIIAQDQKQKFSKVFGESGYSEEVSSIIADIVRIPVTRDTTFVPFFVIGWPDDSTRICQETCTYKEFGAGNYQKGYLLVKSTRKKPELYKK